MIKVTVGGQDVALDLSRTLAQSGIRPGSTLKLKLTGLLGGMPTGHPETAARAPTQSAALATATPLDADAQGPPEPGPSEHLDAARRALVRAEGLSAELAGDLARIFPPPAAASPASDATRGSDSGASAWAYDASPASALGTDASRATAPDVPADAGEHGDDAVDAEGGETSPLGASVVLDAPSTPQVSFPSSCCRLCLFRVRRCAFPLCAWPADTLPSPL